MQMLREMSTQIALYSRGDFFLFFQSCRQFGYVVLIHSTTRPTILYCGCVVRLPYGRLQYNNSQYQFIISILTVLSVMSYIVPNMMSDMIP